MKRKLIENMNIIIVKFIEIRGGRRKQNSLKNQFETNNGIYLNFCGHSGSLPRNCLQKLKCLMQIYFLKKSKLYSVTQLPKLNLGSKSHRSPNTFFNYFLTILRYSAGKISSLVCTYCSFSGLDSRCK